MKHKKSLSIGIVLFLFTSNVCQTASYACTNPEPYNNYTRVDQMSAYNVQNGQEFFNNRYVHWKNVMVYDAYYNNSYTNTEIDPDDIIDEYLGYESGVLYSISNSGYDTYNKMLQNYFAAMNGSRNFAKEYYNDLRRGSYQSSNSNITHIIPYDAFLEKQAEYYKNIGIQQTFSPTLDEIQAVPYQWEYVDNNYRLIFGPYVDEISNWRLKNKVDGTYVKNTWFQSPLTNGWYYFNSDGYMVCGHTPDGYLTYYDGLWTGSEIIK